MEAANEYPEITVFGPHQSGKTTLVNLNRGNRADLFFYRDTHGNEVDLVIRKGSKLIAIEIKSASTFITHFFDGIENFKKAVGLRFDRGYVLYNGHEQYLLKGIKVINPISYGDRGELEAI